jgi:hypothetical protein
MMAVPLVSTEGKKRVEVAFEAAAVMAGELGADGYAVLARGETDHV